EHQPTRAADSLVGVGKLEVRGNLLAFRADEMGREVLPPRRGPFPHSRSCGRHGCSVELINMDREKPVASLSPRGQKGARKPRQKGVANVRLQ
ncbi:hypothetical protein T310_6730, partial [Rasamsonia emersonii CBS 393.64]